MPPRRLSPAYAARNARARALGYRNYYDYRIHNHGRIAPDRAAPKGEARQRLRGHRGPADIERDIRAGGLVQVWGWERDPTTGRYTQVELMVVDAKGRERLYRLQGRHLERSRLKRFVEKLAAAGATFSAGGSLDVRRVVSELEMETEDDGG